MPKSDQETKYTGSRSTRAQSSAASLQDDNISTKFDKESRASASKSDVIVVTPQHEMDRRDRSTSRSRDSVNDDPRSSYVDSISAASGRHNWSGSKDIADYDPSISSIKGDSVSATIADYHRKHHISLDNQSRTSASRLGGGGGCGLGEPSSSSTRPHDDASVNINFYAASSSTTGMSTTGGGGGGNTDRHYQHRGRRQTKQRRVATEQQRTTSRRRSSSAIEQPTLATTAAVLAAAAAATTTIEFDDLPPATVYQIEPIVIRGNGNLTLFGLSNSFDSDFPAALLGRVSREEFSRTISHINTLLRDQQSLSAKLLLIGSLFCCCSLGFSLVCPSILLKRRCKMNLEKFLLSENNRLYSKLGLNWKLGQRCFNRFVEHVIIIEFSPKIDPYMPD